jgi:outer membrane lipoprotein-sorting protein
LYPKNPASVKYKYITLYIVKSNVELKKAILKTKDGTTMTYVLNKFTANPAVEDSKFVFDIKKYPGYKVIKD